MIRGVTCATMPPNNCGEYTWGGTSSIPCKSVCVCLFSHSRELKKTTCTRTCQPWSTCKYLLRFQVELPMARARLGTWKPMCQDVPLPHELFGYMWQCQPKAFQKYVQGPAGQIKAFWKEMAGNPQLAGHPTRLEANYQKTTIPIATHGDGVPFAGVGRRLVQKL